MAKFYETFFGEDISKGIAQIKQENEHFFNLYEEIGKVTRLIIKNNPIDSQNVSEIVESCLLAKSINTFEAIVRLCTMGFVAESKVLVRILLETVIIIRYIKKDPINLKHFLDASKHERLRRLKNILNYPEFFEGLANKGDIERLSKEKDNILNEITNNSIARKNIRKWAEEVDMLEAYIIAYDLFSGEIHIDPHALEQYLDKDTDDNVKQILIWSFDLFEVRHILFTCYDLFMKALDTYCASRGLDMDLINEIRSKRIEYGPLLI